MYMEIKSWSFFTQSSLTSLFIEFGIKSPFILNLSALLSSQWSSSCISTTSQDSSFAVPGLELSLSFKSSALAHHLGLS